MKRNFGRAMRRHLQTSKTSPKWLIFFKNLYFNECCHFTVEFDGDIELANGFERFMEIHFLAIDVKAFRRQKLGNVHRCHRTI